MSEEKSKYEDIYKAYQKLPKQSYELLVRSLGIHEWLKEAYDLVKENPGMSSGEIYARWSDTFNKIYENVFALFHRPFRMMMYPLNFPQVQSEEYTPKSFLDLGMDSFKIGAETQSKIANQMIETYKDYTLSETEEMDTEQIMKKLRPSNLIRNMVREEVKAYFEAWDNYLDWMGESQFIIPKDFFNHMKDGIGSYSDIYELWDRYESMFRNVWENSLELLAEEIEFSEKEMEDMSFDEFFNIYTNIFDEEYDDLLRSEEFIQVQNNLTKAMANTFGNTEEMMDDILEMYPTLPFAPRREIDKLEKRVHTYRKKVDELERKVRNLEKELESVEKTETESIDYQELVDGTISEVREKVSKKGIDFEKLLTYEKANRDRKTLKKWIRENMEE